MQKAEAIKKIFNKDFDVLVHGKRYLVIDKRPANPIIYNSIDIASHYIDIKWIYTHLEKKK